MTLRQRLKSALASLKTKLEGRGFVEVRRDVFMREARGPEWSFWLGVNRAIHADSFELNPVIGVRSLIIEDEVGRLMASDSFAGTPSLAVTLRSLVRDIEHPWLFDETVEADQRIESIDAALLRDGMPFLEAHTSYEALLEAYGLGEPDNYGRQYRYPVVLNLLGRRAEAIAYLERYTKSFPTEYAPKSYFADYSAFAARFVGS